MKSPREYNKISRWTAGGHNVVSNYWSDSPQLKTGFLITFYDDDRLSFNNIILIFLEYKVDNIYLQLALFPVYKKYEGTAPTSP